MLLKRLQLWDLRLLLLRSIREENVVINQVNQFGQRLPIAMIRPQWSKGKTGKGRWKQARTKPLKRKSAKQKRFLAMNVRRKSWQFLIQVGFPFSDLFCFFFFFLHKICLTCVCLCSFFTELNKLAGSSAIDELNVKCGVCKGIKVIAGDRTVTGKVQHFLKSRFSKKKKRYKFRGIQHIDTLLIIIMLKLYEILKILIHLFSAI